MNQSSGAVGTCRTKDVASNERLDEVIKDDETEGWRASPFYRLELPWN